MKDKNKKWYDSANVITNLIIITILLIIIFSQSFAIGGNGSLELFTSIINHNSIYLCVLVYFVILKISFGKRYFNYLSVFLIFIYFIISMTSLLTLIQTFTLNSVLNFILNSLLLIYLVHTLLRDTRVWREFYLGNSPFNELSNDFIFYSIMIVSVILLAVNLINTLVISGIVMPILDTIFILLLSRYIFLYRDYLDRKKIDASNVGNFDVVRDKVQGLLDKTDIDEKIVDSAKNLGEKVSETTKKVGKDIDKFVKDNKIDEKIDKIGDKVVDTTKNVKKKTKKITKKIENKIDDKIVNNKKSVKKKTNKKGDK